MTPLGGFPWSIADHAWITLLSCTMSVQLQAEITRSERGLSRLYERTK